MTNIEYQVKSNDATIIGEITWAASEQFSELTGRTYDLGKMEAVQIDKIPDLSPIAKLLLSAVAGAIIQRLLDQDIPAEDIFSTGTFRIVK